MVRKQDVEIYCITADSVFMRHPDIRENMSWGKVIEGRNLYEGYLYFDIENIGKPSTSFFGPAFRGIEWYDHKDYGRTWRDAPKRFPHSEEEIKNVKEALITLIYCPQIAGIVSDKFRQLKALCPESKG